MTDDGSAQTEQIVMALTEPDVDILESYRDRIMELSREDESGRLYELYNRLRIFIEERKRNSP